MELPTEAPTHRCSAGIASEGQKVPLSPTVMPTPLYPQRCTLAYVGVSEP
jgi:hypothetical protein